MPSNINLCFLSPKLQFYSSFSLTLVSSSVPKKNQLPPQPQNVHRGIHYRHAWLPKCYESYLFSKTTLRECQSKKLWKSTLRKTLKVKVKLLSRVRLFATPWTVAYQVPLSMGFSRQEYWSGLPLPSPGDLPDPGIEPGSPSL